MIVTSRRCLFNILFQIFPLNKMLNANYYLLDVKSQTQLDQYKNQSMAPDISIDDFGNYKVNPSQTSLTQYHINAGRGELDPTQFMAHLITGDAWNPDDIQRIFQEYLKKPETKVTVFDFLFAQKPRGNGMQVLVIYNEDIVTNYAHTICQYLSYEFGCDINFIDPLYRPDVKGNTTYQGNFNYIGNKNRGLQLICDLKDYKLRTEFDSFLLQIQGQMNAVDQMSARLNVYDVPKLIYLYNLLFPNKPLPPNYYEHEQLKQMIISMTLNQLPQNKFGNNLYTTNDIQHMIDEYDASELIKHEALDIYDYLT